MSTSRDQVLAQYVEDEITAAGEQLRLWPEAEWFLVERIRWPTWEQLELPLDK